MNILLLAGSPSFPSRSTRLLHHVGEKLALLGHRYAKLQVRDLSAQALLHAVADNYRRNGFRFAVNAANALGLLDRVQPDFIKMDAREIADPAATRILLSEASKRGIQLIFKRLENAKTFELLRRLEQGGSLFLGGLPPLYSGIFV